MVLTRRGLFGRAAALAVGAVAAKLPETEAKGGFTPRTEPTTIALQGFSLGEAGGTIRIDAAAATAFRSMAETPDGYDWLAQGLEPTWGDFDVGSVGGSLNVAESQVARMHGTMASVGMQMTELGPSKLGAGMIEVEIIPFAALDRGAGIHIPAAQQSDWIVAEIYSAAARYGVSGDWLLAAQQSDWIVAEIYSAAARYGVSGDGLLAAQQSDWIVAEIYSAAARYGVSGDWLLSVAQCESQLNPWAVNPVTGDTGLFQFNPGTWEAWGGGNIWSVYEQADKAAWAFSQGLSSHWLCA
jgi:hypothetical protein